MRICTSVLVLYQFSGKIQYGFLPVSFDNQKAGTALFFSSSPLIIFNLGQKTQNLFLSPLVFLTRRKMSLKVSSCLLLSHHVILTLFYTNQTTPIQKVTQSIQIVRKESIHSFLFHWQKYCTFQFVGDIIKNNQKKIYI